MKVFENKLLNEKYFYEKHSSGLNIYLFPKNEYKSSYAIIGTKYGSINKKFKYHSRIVETPEGIAHFLEHKLFECKKGDAFELFSKTGAQSNAYTSFDKTAYLFSCCDKLKDSLKILLDFVQEPYFTEEGVNKEKGIIGQEIRMYEDSPNWQANIGLLSHIYKNHSVRDDIAGSLDSISRITPDMLNTCYNAFYNFSNMTLCIVGNFEKDDILEFIDKNITKKCEEFDTETIFSDEPIGVIENYIEKKMEVLNPIFYIGFKHPFKNSTLSCSEFVCSELLINILALKSGNIYNSLISEGLITTNNLNYGLFNGPYYKSSIFSGESKNPKKVFNIIRNEILSIQSNGFSVGDFERAKKTVYYQFVSSFNRVSSLANILLDLDFSDIQLFDLIDTVSSVDINSVNEQIKKDFNIDNSCLFEIVSI